MKPRICAHTYHSKADASVTPPGPARHESWLLAAVDRDGVVLDASHSARGLASHRSTVRLGMTDEYAIAFLPSVLASFAATHPLVEVSVTCRLSSVLSQMLNNGELDVALVTADSTGRAAPPGGGIYRDRLAWAAIAHGTAHLRRPLPIAVAPPSCAWRKAAVDALDAAGISYRIACTSENYAGQLAPVLAGLALAGSVPLFHSYAHS
jgi:DNA-binding transcriptional LysR family regulator